MVGPAPAVVGGMSTVAATLASEFRADDAVELSLLDSGGGIGPRGYLRFPAALAAVATRRYDLLHLHVASRGSTLRKAMLAGVAARRSVPYVVHLHGAGYVDFLAGLNDRTRAAVRGFFTGAAGIVVLGDAWRDVLVRDLGIAPERMSIVNNGVRPLPRVADADKADDRAVVFVGELSRRKGADLLAQAWTTLVGRGEASGWRCLCLGPTPDAEALASIEAMPAPARASLELVGPVTGDNKDALISRASVFCLPSRAEGLPMALLEAMSAGLPAVCTDVGSIAEVVDDTNGRLIASGDVGALTQALGELLTEDALRARLSDGAFATWNAGFTSARMASRVAAVWAAAVEGRGDE